ncbi:hypothetical protein H7J07_08490 [Mycobacterium koreense]|uniref:hypothetical protein n=1 Tax=Mycolicibacillus koreensis TaxID=1069220 RepID=UPI000B160125|nr:hypothetical protein [Mycolicibacillus koreensis]MCV7248256.1 hypothetical protein [Mycolicibacillus koreensis]BBY55194.1 hypothetical protein MKOR_24450 [Mycolicibacillus koreensis]
MIYLLLILALGTLVYLGWRASQTRRRAAPRVIGPDDDPEFLARLGRGDTDPR